MTEEKSFQVSLENCQGFSIPDRGGKFIPPARNGETFPLRKVILCLSVMYHEASLACRSQNS